MRPIFNSLGSNYDRTDIWLSLKQLVWPNRRLKFKLKKKLEDKFDGKVKLLFSGRDAIEYLLKAYDIGKGDDVLTQAFSCSSVEEAILRVEARPVYFDLKKDQLQTSLKQVKKAYKLSQNAKAVILQHTLGYADEVGQIKHFCDENDLLLIEDLAQAVGAVDQARTALGAAADAVILSFGKDKILDGITGGAAIFKTNLKKQPKIPDWFALPRDLSNKRLVVKLLIYPCLTRKIRLTYSFGLGKVLHRLAKKLKIIWTPIVSPHKHYQSYPAYFAPFVIKRLNQLEQQLSHRRKIAHYYFNQLKDCPQLSLPITQKDISHGTNLRFPLQLEKARQDNRELSNLINHLAKNQVYISDRWYRQPVDSGSVDFSSQYQPGSCPQAEVFSRSLLNLPTHRSIKIKQAEKITNLIMNWIDCRHEKN